MISIIAIHIHAVKFNVRVIKNEKSCKHIFFYRYFYVVAIEHDEKDDRLPLDFKNNELLTYSEGI